MRYFKEIPTLPVAGLNSNIWEIGMKSKKHFSVFGG